MSALMEISTLASSDQGYDIQINTDRNTKDAIFSQAYYNADNGLVTVDLGSHDMANVAHELLHCYQFEMGEANLGIKTNNDFNVQDVRITPQNLFDKTDEVAAYRRGSYFGEMERYSINSLPNIYKNLPSEHRNKHNTKPFSYGINNPYEYQRIATKTNSAYRINNVTYHP